MRTRRFSLTSLAAGLLAFAVALAIAAIATGHPVALIPIAVLTVLVGGALAFTGALSRPISEDPAPEPGRGEHDAVPRTFAIEEGERPVGDTDQAHDEINPHDLPPDAPGRRAAEEQAASGNDDGLTGGDRDPSHAARR